MPIEGKEWHKPIPPGTLVWVSTVESGRFLATVVEDRGPLIIIRDELGDVYDVSEESVEVMTKENPIEPKEWSEPIDPADEEGRIRERVDEDWDLERLTNKLKQQTWNVTEKHETWIRIDRMIYISSSQGIEELTSDAYDTEDWTEMMESGASHEATDDYMNYLAEAVAKVMGEHVYGTFEDDDAFLGQYEEGPEAELRERFTIED